MSHAAPVDQHPYRSIGLLNVEEVPAGGLPEVVRSHASCDVDRALNSLAPLWSDPRWSGHGGRGHIGGEFSPS